MNEKQNIETRIVEAHKSALCVKSLKKFIAFETPLNRNLLALPYELIYHRYKIEEYLKFKIYDSMEREIQANSCRDRIVEYARGHILFIPL